MFLFLNFIMNWVSRKSFLNDNVDEEGKLFSNSQNSAAGCCLAFAWFFGNFRLALLIKVLLIKKACIYSRNREMFKMLGNSLKNTCKGFSKCKILLTRKKCGTTLYSNYRGSFSHLLRVVPAHSARFEKIITYFLNILNFLIFLINNLYHQNHMPFRGL